MCGIVGVIGPDALGKVFSGLKALEYRGYDSWGIAVPEGKTFYVEKRVGKIGDAQLSKNFSGAKAAIGHTRWATHGKVVEKNAHPHLSMDGSVAIVHNGIVENFSELKAGLMGKGYVFRSDTDSEVIANLVQEKMEKNNFEDAVRLSMLETEGGYAIAAMAAGENKIVCVRNGSPLVLGIDKGEFFVASDATAFLEHTRSAVFLEDSSLAVLAEGGVKVFNVENGKEIRFSPKQLTWNVEQAKKGRFAHFMLKEIHEQPLVIESAVKQDPYSFGNFLNFLKTRKKIVLVGCGSSYHACLLGAKNFNSVGLEAYAFLASEFNLNINEEEVLILAVSQSGETADVIEVIKQAKNNHVPVLSIVNVMDSTIMRMSNCSLLLNAGPEICVLSTKTFTAQVAMLSLISKVYGGYIRQGERYEKAMNSMVAEFSKIGEAINGVLNSKAEDVKNLAKKLKNHKDIFVIGRGTAYPLALEGALKIKEVSYIHAEGFAGGELKHGAMALLEEGTPVIVLSTPETRKEILSNAMEMKSRGAYIIGFDSEDSAIYDRHISIPDLGCANPISLIVPIQMLAYYLAVIKKLDPDKPRNLAKSCTVK